ncbi:hypothetical protein KR054_011529, partial [Drosophila jambulina]
LVFGRELRIPRTMFDRVTEGSGLRKETMEDRRKRLKNMRAEATTHMEQAAEQQKRHYDLRKREWRPNIRDLVRCKTHQLSNAAEKFNAKLAPKYDGPWKVVKFTSSVIVNVKDTKTRKKDMKPFVGSNTQHSSHEDHERIR